MEEIRTEVKKERNALIDKIISENVEGPATKEQMQLPEATRQRGTSLKALAFFGEGKLEQDMKQNLVSLPAIPPKSTPKVVQILGNAQTFGGEKVEQVLGDSTDDDNAQVRRLAKEAWEKEVAQRQSTGPSDEELQGNLGEFDRRNSKVVRVLGSISALAPPKIEAVLGASTDEEDAKVRAQAKQAWEQETARRYDIAVNGIGRIEELKSNLGNYDRKNNKVVQMLGSPGKLAPTKASKLLGSSSERENSKARELARKTWDQEVERRRSAASKGETLKDEEQEEEDEETQSLSKEATDSLKSSARNLTVNSPETTSEFASLLEKFSIRKT